MPDNKPLDAMVTSRTCPLCGHQEIGFTTGDNVFHPLKLGTLIRILHAPDYTGSSGEIPGSEAEPSSPQEEGGLDDSRVWVPDPIKDNKTLRLKYGVMVGGGVSLDRVSGELYELAYLEKLRRLIEKEVHVPLPVILDRFFLAPHLASGNPKQIAEAMWRELGEIRQPVEEVQAWLGNQDPRVFNLRDSTGRQSEAFSGEEPAQGDWVKELEELTLEGFLGLL